MTYETLAKATLALARRDGVLDDIEPFVLCWRELIRKKVITEQQALEYSVASLRAGGLYERVLAEVEPRSAHPEGCRCLGCLALELVEITRLTVRGLDADPPAPDSPAGRFHRDLKASLEAYDQAKD